MKKVISGNEAASLAVKYARVQVISAYPITPQTTISEKLSELCGSGELDAKFVKVESEHSAMATLIGASSAGVRTFTATSAQGLALMHELLFWASGARLPIVMVDVNRAMAAPWTIWCDQTDSLAQRDTGWMQFYCWSNQEILDSIICSFKISEELLIPCMVCYDGFYISHTTEAVDLPSQDVIDTFLPPRKAKYFIDTNNPRTFSGGTLPNNFMEMRYKLHEAFNNAQDCISETYNEYARLTGRTYNPIEPYFMDGADKVLIASGSASSTAFHVVKRLRSSGKNVGLLRIRQLRPFPTVELLSYLRQDVKYGVLDRNLSPGTGGVFSQEIRAAVARNGRTVFIGEFIAGLGGRDIAYNDIEEIFAQMDNEDNGCIHWIGLKR